MKRRLQKILILCLAVCLTAFAFAACKEKTDTPPVNNNVSDASNGNTPPVSPPAYTQNLTYVLNGEGTGYIVSKGSVAGGDIVIPSEYAGLPIVGIGSFTQCDPTSVTIPASVRSIEANAFYGCTHLRTVTFAEGSQLAGIGNAAFMYCIDLAEIVIPSGVTSIGRKAFAGDHHVKMTLADVTFANTAGWYRSNTENAAEGEDADVSDPAVNANNLKENYTEQYWYRR